MRKKVLIIFAVFLFTVFGFVFSCVSFSEILPEGRNQETANSLANKMLIAINDNAWQKTGAVSWTFMKKHDHLWDRKRNLARVKWKQNEVYIDINAKKGRAFIKGQEIEGKEKDELIDKAWKHWVNDSFWLNPVSKVFDKGTSRSIVKLKDGRLGLKVSYTLGGNTPGDSYVWILNENHFPIAWKMWVSIIPIKGIEIPWTKWKTTETGVKICVLHDAVIDIEINNVKTGNTLRDLNIDEDIFLLLE